MQYKSLQLIGLLLVLASSNVFCQSDEINNTSMKRYFEYRQASMYTHLNWTESLSDKISLSLKPIVNFSGIPVENRQEKAEYFNHGKLPRIMNNIYLDAFYVTRMFNPSLVTTANDQPDHQSDYQVELIIDQYELPFKYAPDDHWWGKLHDQTDRWLQTPANTGVKLTIKVTSGLKKIRPWIDSVKMVLSNCDLNEVPQPQSSFNNKDELSKKYLSTASGQTFLAATNFLVLKTAQRLNLEPQLGKVARKFGDEIYLTSQSASFTQGQVLDLFFNNDNTGKAEVPAGKIKVIKASNNHAMAYPISLRSDHITIGDWVEISHSKTFNRPKSTFIATDSCAEVSSSAAFASL
jgi:hypothetical protein